MMSFCFLNCQNIVNYIIYIFSCLIHCCAQELFLVSSKAETMYWNVCHNDFLCESSLNVMTFWNVKFESSYNIPHLNGDCLLAAVMAKWNMTRLVNFESFFKRGTPSEIIKICNCKSVRFSFVAFLFSC